MEDYKPTSAAETDPSDDDDDEEEESGNSSSSSTKASRAIINKMAAEKQREKKIPVVPSLAERIFQKKEEKPERKEPEEKPPEKDGEAEAETAPDQAEVHDEEQPEEIIVLESGEEREAAKAGMEAAPEAQAEPWDEGEITEDGEINLARTSSWADRPVSEVSETNSSPEDAPEPAQTREEPASERDETPALAHGGDGGGEGPPEGPEDEAGAVDEPEPARPRTASGTTGGGGYSSVVERFMGVPGAHAGEDAMNEAIHRATKRGLSRGVVTGLLGGLYLGHRGKKKLTAKFEKTLETKDTEIKHLQGNQVVMQNQLGSLENAKERARKALNERPVLMHEAATEMSGVAVVRAETASEKSKEPYMRIESVPGAPLTSRLEALSAAPLVIGAETLRRQFSTRERVRYAVDERGSMAIKRSGDQTAENELPPEEHPITEDLYHTPDGRRVEMSSWHRIEVDAKTGKVVNNPEVEYGEEFRHEIQQEVLKGQRNRGGRGAAIQLGNMASSSAHSTGGGTASQDSPVPANSSSVPVALSSMQSVVKNDSDDEPMDPLVWVIVGGFVLILFLFAILR